VNSTVVTPFDSLDETRLTLLTASSDGGPAVPLGPL